jgi:hypothetical protein
MSYLPVYILMTYIVTIIVFLLQCIVYVYVACQSFVTSCRVHCTHQPNLYLPACGQDVQPKHVGTLYNKYKTLCNKLVVNLCEFYAVNVTYWVKCTVPLQLGSSDVSFLLAQIALSGAGIWQWTSLVGPGLQLEKSTLYFMRDVLIFPNSPAFF